MKAFPSLFILIFFACFPANWGCADDRLGVNTHYAQGWDQGSILLIAGTGASWIRDELPWATFEASQGSYSLPQNFVAWVTAAQRAALKVDLLISYGNPIYANQYDPVAMPKALGWLATQLKSFPAVQAIEIVNEPNNDYAAREGTNWKQLYVNLLNACYASIKAANPQLTVIGLGAGLGDDLAMLAMGVQADGLTSHPYPPPHYLPEWAYEPPATTFLDFLTRYRAADARPQWHTEWGISTAEGYQQGWRTCEYNQAQFIARRLCESLGLGVEHTFWYAFRDETYDETSAYSSAGIITSQDQGYNPKQGYYVMQRIMSILANQKANGYVGVNTAYSDYGLDMTNFYGYSFYNNSNNTSVGVAWFGGTDNYWPNMPWGKSQKARIDFYHPGTHSVMAVNALTGVTWWPSWAQWVDHVVILSTPITDEPVFYIAQ